jgi:hypothetical protein
MPTVVLSHELFCLSFGVNNTLIGTSETHAPFCEASLLRPNGLGFLTKPGALPLIRRFQRCNAIVMLLCGDSRESAWKRAGRLV